MELNNKQKEHLVLSGFKRYKELSFWGKRIIPPHKRFVVLDDGCGTGAEMAQIARWHRGYLVGIDVNINLLIAAKKLLKKVCGTSKNVDFVLGDSTNLPFVDGRFDFVLSSFVLEHIKRREIALEEMYRVLKHGGCATITLDTYLRCIRRCLEGYREYLKEFFKLMAGACPIPESLRSLNKMIRQPTSNRVGLLQKLRRCLSVLSYIILPIRHGDYEHSVQEFVAHLPSSWLYLIKRAGFQKPEIIFPSCTQRVAGSRGEMMIKAYKMKDD